ncbi:hypothetical protein DU80_00985, partial [Methanosarcina mazei]
LKIKKIKDRSKNSPKNSIIYLITFCKMLFLFVVDILSEVLFFRFSLIYSFIICCAVYKSVIDM